MTVKIEASKGGIPHNTIMGAGLVGSLVCIYLTSLNSLAGTDVFSFFGGLGAVFALVWGTNTIKNLCSYGIGTGVPSAGMMALGSGVIAMLTATRLAVISPWVVPIAALLIAAVIGAILGYISNSILNMNIPVMVISLTELAMVGAMSLLGFSAMAGGTFAFDGLAIGTGIESTAIGELVMTAEVPSYAASMLGGGVIVVIFMLSAIALQHSFNACLGPNESQDRTLMLAAECGFLSAIGVAIMSLAFISFAAVLISVIVSFGGWFYTFTKYLELSKRDAYAWLDAKPIIEPTGGE